MKKERKKERKTEMKKERKKIKKKQQTGQFELATTLGQQNDVFAQGVPVARLEAHADNVLQNARRGHGIAGLQSKNAEGTQTKGAGANENGEREERR